MIYQIGKTQDDVAKAMYLADGMAHRWETCLTKEGYLRRAEAAAREMGVVFKDPPPMPVDPRYAAAKGAMDAYSGVGTDWLKECIAKGIVAAIEQDRQMR